MFTENQQILTEKKSFVRHRENENLVEFSIQLQWQTRILCMKSPKKFHKILAHKIHQAPIEFFLRHRESECLWLLGSPELGQKSLFGKDSPTLAEREKVYHYENFTNTSK